MANWNAQQVIELYDSLGLSVCDDAAAIQQKLKSQEARFLKDKNNPDPATRHRADIWFKNATALRSRRDEMLGAVYESFAEVARAVVSAGVAGGMREVSPQLQQDLLQIAYRQFRLDGALADRFLTDFMRDEGLQIGKTAVRVAMVTDFEAVPGKSEIRLQWTIPARDCEKVEILRDTAATPKGAKTNKRLGTDGRRIYVGTDTGYVDRDVQAGHLYRYWAHGVLRGIEGPDTPVTAFCLGEVHQAAAVWKDQAIQVSWHLPSPLASSHVFRRAGAPPALRRSSEGVSPADDATQHFPCGANASFTDRNVEEGKTYYYRIVADYESGQLTKGCEVKVTVPKAPPPVRDVFATPRHSHGKEVVALSWKAAQSSASVQYVVVRRDGAVASARIEEGTIVAETNQTDCLDETVLPGRRYTYSVFARSGKLASRAASAPPVVILTEVSKLKAETGDQTVELYWQPPKNVKSVIVRRSLDPPANHTRGAVVKCTGPGHAKDDQLHNGQQYHYLVACVYRLDGADEAVSEGVRITAIPDRLPERVENFAVRPAHQEVVCEWDPPAYGQVVVLRSSKPHDLPPGRRLRSDELDRFGERLPAVARGRAIDTQPNAKSPYYSAFTTAGPHAIVGTSAVCVLCPDVCDLRLSPTQGGVVLRWTWPGETTVVRVARRSDAWPTGPKDPQATITTLTHYEYSMAGDRFVDTIREERGHLHYIVFVQATDAPGEFYSSGTSPDCRGDIQWRPWMTVRYRLHAHDPETICMTWMLEAPFSDLSGLILVANQQRPPTHADDGIELFRWTPDADEIRPSSTYEQTVSLAPVQQHRWSRFFAKVFVVDPVQQSQTLVIHPDTCTPIRSSGKLANVKPLAIKRKRRTAICPTCFEEFTPDRMLFSSYNGGEPTAGNYTWIDRLLRRPPRPPRNRQGQLLARKLCPNQHVLPFTAGSQAELVIGMIGAKFSGKSHYIASLIHQLMGHVGTDLDAALMPVTDETPQRYQREFYDPLFKNHLELQFTLGTPAPLVYDLTLAAPEESQGGHRARAVTLALYDTAGENFDQPDTVRQMVQYVRVASGIMLLVDPLQLPSVRESLPSSVQVPDVEDPHTIIGRVLTELENGKVITENGPMSIPVAVVLTKADVLRDAGLIAPNRLWCTDARHIGYFHQEAHEDMTGMVGEFMQRWCPAVYTTVIRRFERHAFFAVSATGCASDTTTRRYKYVSPWRVEDPLLWLLAQLQVIPADDEWKHCMVD